MRIALNAFQFRLDGILCAILKYLQCIKVVFAGSISFTRDVPKLADSQKFVSRYMPVCEIQALMRLIRLLKLRSGQML